MSQDVTDQYLTLKKDYLKITVFICQLDLVLFSVNVSLNTSINVKVSK